MASIVVVRYKNFVDDRLRGDDNFLVRYPERLFKARGRTASWCATQSVFLRRGVAPLLGARSLAPETGAGSHRFFACTSEL